MDTNSNIPAVKKVVSVEILHLDDLGYGPQGKHTRREWRKECLDNLIAGKKQFEAWQETWVRSISYAAALHKFDFVVTYDDGLTELISDQFEYLPQCYPLDYIGQVFEVHLLARGLIFSQPVLFAGAIFQKDAYFNSVNFKESVNFNHSVFHNEVYFNNTIFDEIAFFNKITYKSNVYFNKAIFNKKASYSYTFFLENSYFFDTAFNGDVVFNSVIFAGRVFFRKTIFNHQCRFDNDFDSKNIKWFQKTTFASTAEFENAVFGNIGHFERVEFLTHFPAFRGCKIDSTRLEFSEETSFPLIVYSDEAIKNISFLKRLADEQGQTDQALNFNARELIAKAKQPAAGFWFQLFTLAYEVVSDFGRSFTKPLKYYFGLLLIVYILALGNAVVNSPKDCKAENLRILSDLWRDDTPCDISKTNPDDKTRLNGYRAAAEYTVYRAAGILDFSDNGKGTDAVARRLFGQSYEPGWMRFVGLVKAIASTALLFLAALGLRNKYRIK